MRVLAVLLALGLLATPAWADSTAFAGFSSDETNLVTRNIDDGNDPVIGKPLPRVPVNGKIGDGKQGRNSKKQ
jgi:hypothetical protein